MWNKLLTSRENLQRVLAQRRVAGFTSVEDPQHVGYEEDQ
jgi:hypothetical protein